MASPAETKSRATQEPDADEAMDGESETTPVDVINNHDDETDEPLVAEDRKAKSKLRPGAPTAVVGLGASAGGLEALTELFRNMRADTGLSFVIVQHLDPRHESQMASLLGRITHIPVVEADEGMRLEPNHIYIIPPDHLMTVGDGTLHLHDRPLGPGHQGAIDLFLNSLAEDSGDRAMAAILSGTLSDGRDGLVAVRRRDGFTFAQDLDSARYGEMPRNAIRTGFVDFVLPPEKMARHMARLADHLVQPEDKISTRAEPERRKLIRMVLQATGVDLAQYKKETLDRRIQRRILLNQCRDLTHYVEFLGQNPEEVERFYEDALIHVTGFFRDPEVYEAVSERILKQLLIERQSDEPLRIWVAGCSTGEEPYSLAMLIDQFQRDHNLRIPINIFATDISEKAIQTARLGIYSTRDLQSVPLRMRKEYFAQVQGAYQVAKHIRSMIIFAVHDITTDPPFSSMDLVSCRNLLIYLEPGAQRQAISVLHYALRAGGFLVLGSAETPGRDLGGFREVDARNRLYEKREGAAFPSLRLRAPFRPPAMPAGERGAPTPARGEDGDIVRAADRRLLDGLVHSSVIIDRQYRVIAVRGDGDRFLRMGHGIGDPTLLRVLRGGAADIRRAVENAWRSGKSKTIQATFLHEDGKNLVAAVDAFAIGSDGSHAVVSFREPERIKLPAMESDNKHSIMDIVSGRVSQENRLLRHRVREMEARLDAVIEDYETTLEELRSANEEAMSTNEELQSTNEELQTATEESQSTTEELRTLNDELVHRNHEVQKINNDMVNILNIVELPLVVVDNQKKITRLTAGAERLFKAGDDMVGENLALLNKTLEVDLVEVVGRVMRTLQTRSETVQDRNGDSWTVTAHPYRTAENRIDGAVIACQRTSAT